MQGMSRDRSGSKLLWAVALAASVGVALGFVGSRSLAQMAAPTEHKGLEVAALGVVSADSMEQQIGLAGYKMQLREITIMPGGQIAKHSHENRPGLVKVVKGAWTEGRPSGERIFSGKDRDAILEDRGTVHWFWNRGKEPATALVCDIVADG